jgi:hypothetical protein
MKTRGWKLVDADLPPMILSKSVPANSELTSVPKTSSVYKKIEQQMKLSFGKDPLEFCL